jgi:bacterioferritin-associated ferredoxin
MIVCQCNGISDREIRRLVREGASSRLEVARACGAGAACGGCLPTIHAIIVDAKDELSTREEPSPGSPALVTIARLPA